MDTTKTLIALGTILLLLLPYLSIADNIYSPHDRFIINCGSSTNFSTPYGENWIADNNFLRKINDSVAATAQTPSNIQGPYTTARLSHSQFTYSFPVTAGPKFIRLFFFSSSYQNNFDRSKAYFSVIAGPYTLLQHFNASLNADFDDDPNNPDILFREYCINLKEDQNLTIAFIPSNIKQSYAFINGIQIVSMPSYLYYTKPENYYEIPQLIFANSPTPYRIENKSALETMYRLNAGGDKISPSEDTGMLRTWDFDNNYVVSRSEAYNVEFGNLSKLNFNKISNYTAPDKVYRTQRNMGANASMNMKFNLTWQFSVDSGFYYLLRLYFCELSPKVEAVDYMRFFIFIADELATNRADILYWVRERAEPVVKEFVVSIPETGKKANLSLKMGPHRSSFIQDAKINGIEIFKISNSGDSLAGQNPDPPVKAREGPFQSPNDIQSPKKKPIGAIAGAVCSVALLSFILAALFLIKGKGLGWNQKDGTSHGGGSSLPTSLCRHFTVAEIKAATNNFDELFIVGVGGFGDVYKGYIDGGSTRVAIKRLKKGSQQGLNEFLNEIEMLSQLRHMHLVSLIGYCYESNEMILVYDFMDRGTLREHLYDTDNPSLSWNQRLQICIGAARGLHYLHAGAKHMIIHRDVKSTNILLDEKLVAKVSDFGLCRLGPTGSSMTHVSTTVKGSVGYLDPEYYKRQRLTEKSDVYSFGVVLLEVLSGRQPLLRTVEKQQVSLVDWTKNLHKKGSLVEIVDPTLKEKIAPQCLNKFGDVALSCLLEDGTQRPSMNDVVAMLEFVLLLHDSAVKGVIVSGDGDHEDSSEDMFSSSYGSVQPSDYSDSSGLNTNIIDYNYGRKGSETLLIPENVFSEIKDPKGR
ncbi:hypothetical protein VNO78_25875 [Psophocarpus tetragonolobus]|uniref:Protein kinase domain-containing protein n=1 Tax=Psophocarpus tetragonolobus TaxID=3891 RepID=A0AAN9S8J6_PSOTE